MPTQLSRRSQLWQRLAVPRYVAAVAAVLLVTVSAPLAPAVPASARTATLSGATPEQISSHLAVVESAYNQILDSYPRPQDPGTLLQPALESVLADAAKAGHALVPPDLAHPHLPSNRIEAFTIFSSAYSTFATAVTDEQAQAAAFKAVAAMCRSLRDDHTGFLAPQQVAGFASLLSGAPSFGSGLLLGQRPSTYVQEVAPNGPADRAGLRAGDVISTINGSAITPDDPQGAIPPGAAPYTIRVNRPGAGTLEFKVTPGTFSFPAWSATVLPNGVGLMRLRAFADPWMPLDDGRTIVQALDDALEQFESAGVQDWVLDLRDNPGGSGLLADAITGRFVRDSLSGRQSDARGHLAQDLTDGHLFRQQRPLAVLINSNSTSSSEIAASTLKESGRAVLVGQQTGGALANAALWSIGEGAALELTFADVRSGIADATLDRAGVAPDITAADRSADDYASGRDPQLAAAITALREKDQAPVAAPISDLIPLGRAGVEALLGRLQPGAAALAPLPGMQPLRDLGGYTLTSYNDYNGWTTATIETSGSGGGRNAVQTREAARARGWLGGRVELYGSDPLGPALWAEWEAYADNAGAAAAVAANDFPDQWIPIATPISLGDNGTAAMRGDWGDRGTIILRWQRGTVVLTAEYQASPGMESIDAARIFAGEVDTAYSIAVAPSMLLGFIVQPLERTLGTVASAHASATSGGTRAARAIAIPAL